MYRLILSGLFLALSISCATTQDGEVVKSEKSNCVQKEPSIGSRIRTTCPSKS